MGGEYYTKTTKKLCLWHTEHGKTTHGNALVEFLSHCLWGCEGQLWVKTPSPGYTHSEMHAGHMPEASRWFFAYLRDQLSCQTSVQSNATYPEHPERHVRHSAWHSPGAWARSRPGRRRSSRVAACDACQSCSPETMMSHSCWGCQSGPSWHPGKRRQPNRSRMPKNLYATLMLSEICCACSSFLIGYLYSIYNYLFHWLLSVFYIKLFRQY